MKLNILGKEDHRLLKWIDDQREDCLFFDVVQWISREMRMFPNEEKERRWLGLLLSTCFHRECERVLKHRWIRLREDLVVSNIRCFVRWWMNVPLCNRRICTIEAKKERNSRDEDQNNSSLDKVWVCDDKLKTNSKAKMNSSLWSFSFVYCFGRICWS